MRPCLDTIHAKGTSHFSIILLFIGLSTSWVASITRRFGKRCTLDPVKRFPNLTAALFVPILAACATTNGSVPATTTPTQANPPAAATSAPTATRTATPLPTATSTPIPKSTLTFRYGPSASEGDRAIVRGAIELTEAFVARVTGVQTADATVYVFGGLNEVLAIYTPLTPSVMPIELARRLHFTVAEAVYGGVVVYTGSEVWRGLNDVQRFRVPAHEYFHVLQLDRLGRQAAEEIARTRVDQVHAGGPIWLFEGTAEYVSWLVIDDTGLANLQSHLGAEASIAAANPLSLTMLETPLDYASEGDAALAHSLLAVTLLMRDHEIGDTLRFYETLGRGQPWREAFRSAFGLSVDDFYARYQEFVRSGFRR